MPFGETMNRGPLVTATSVSLLPYDGTDPSMTWDGVGINTAHQHHHHTTAGEGIINAPIPPQHLSFDIGTRGEDSLSDIASSVISSSSSSSAVSHRGFAQGSECGDTNHGALQMPSMLIENQEKHGPMSFWTLVKFMAVILWSIVAIFLIWYLYTLRQPIHSFVTNFDQQTAAMFNSTVSIAQNLQESLRRATRTPIIGIANPFAPPPGQD